MRRILQKPIPIFGFLQGVQFKDKFIDEAKIYVLEYVDKPVLEEKYLRIDRAGLPKGFEHGMVRGITVWGNFVAYWLEVW